MATLSDLLRAGYKPPTESPMGDPIVEHFRTLPQQLAQNQAAMDSAMGSWNKTDFATGQPNPNYRPEAINELTQLMPNVGALTAWHGTPHKIVGNFDISKVGTGEGAQAYGHGMYFAENPAVAKEYQKIVQGPESTAQHYLQMYKTPEIAISALEGGITPNLTAEAKKHSLDAINVLKSGKELKGNLYKVDIPDEHIPNMLDWDKPLAQQNKQVLEGLKKLNDPYINKAINSQPKLSKDGEYWEYMGNTYGSKSEALEDATPQRIISGYTNIGKTPEEVSKALNNTGIKGISYLDQGSRIEGQGNRNFVVFDPSTVKILEENNKPVSRKDIIEKQVKALKE